jgi:parallel beta helix pectate lyase-like protein
MTTKRIRCTCGRVYDPAKHPKCPDCGAETVVATVAEAASPSQPPPLPPGAAQPTSPPLPFNARPFIIIGAVLLGLILLVVFIRHSRSTEKSDVPSGRSEATASPGSTEKVSGGSDELRALVAKAKPGAEIKVRPGIYAGGLVLARPVRLVADSRNGGQVVIQSEGKECLSVRASGVALQNVQFICNGIGELPAISVSDSATLEMESCKVQSATQVALVATGKASLKAVGSTFTAANGTAVRLNQGAQATFTQCSFPDTLIGLVAVSGAGAELHSCAFERDGGEAAKGAIMIVGGDKSSLTADDCHFTSNPAGIFAADGGTLTITNSPFKSNGFTPARGSSPSGLISVKGARATLTGDYFESNQQGVTIYEAGTLEIQKCNFNGNGLRQDPPAIAGCLPISITGANASATIRNTVVANSSPYAIYVVAGGKLLLEDTELSGARAAALVVGDRSGPPAHAEIKRGHFLRSGAGIGVIAGSSADVEDSECKENEDGVVMLDRGSRMNLKRTGILGNKDHGLHVYAEAELSIADSDIQNNARGAQSGTPRKSADRATVKLENCRIGGNTVFGVGAYTKSDLVLNACTFDTTNKTNILKERGANVQTDAPVAETSPAPDESATPEKSEGGQARRSKRTPQPTRPRNDDIYRLLRRFRP